MVPIWKNENDMYITPDPIQSNPVIYYVNWVVVKSGYAAIIMDDGDVDGFYMCPYVMDQWAYECKNYWYEDSTLKEKE